MRYCLGILCACFCASSAAAQLTTVSGTVTDANGIPYSGGQIKMQLVTAGGAVTGQPTVTVNNQAQCVSSGFGSAPCKIPFPGTVGPLALSPSGSFTINLQDNTLVTPASTQWLFSVNLSPGEPPPFGFGPQVCTAQLTVSGSAQTITNLASCPALTRNSAALGPFKFNPADPTACVIACPDFGSLVDSVLFVQATDARSFSELIAQSDTNPPHVIQEQLVLNGNVATPGTELGMNIAVSNSAASGTSPGQNSNVLCFQGSATVCATAAEISVGDNNLTTNNGQDIVGIVVGPTFNKPAGNVNQVAGYTVYPPTCGITVIPATCGGGGSIAETANNLYGYDVQDLQGRGTVLTAGFHVRAQTNPTATTHNFAIAVDSGGGPSAFDGIVTTVNCQLGGAAGTTSPAACTSASAGMIAIPASQTTYTVNSTKVTANSEIWVQQMTDNSGLPSAPTCNAGATNPMQNTRVAGTSFSFTLTSVATVTCVKFWIVN